jgi:drug/metabolite transporter (DMT)-like permease
MAAGAISVVAPIAAVAAGVPVIWGVVVSGDKITGLQAIGFVAAVGGSVAASLESRPGHRQLAAGVGWAALAMLAFGGYYVPMHAASTQDWLWPAFLFRCTSVTLVWSIVFVRRAWPRGLRPHWTGLVAIGLLDTGGNALFAAASSTHGLLSVVSVLASLYPVVTVLLARLVLGERVQRTQDAGVVVALAGVVLITAGG